jgi:hypothetical protein
MHDVAVALDHHLLGDLGAADLGDAADIAKVRAMEIIDELEPERRNRAAHRRGEGRPPDRAGRLRRRRRQRSRRGISGDPRQARALFRATEEAVRFARG